MVTVGASIQRQSSLSKAGRESRSTSARRSSFGTPRWDVPVSTMPLQAPLLHMSRASPSTSTDFMSIFQWPSSGSLMGTQLSGVSSLAGLWPPSASSLELPLASSARKNAKVGGAELPIARVRQLRKLNSSESASFGKERPTMPSNVAVSKRTDISRAISIWEVEQIPSGILSCPSSPSTSEERHTTSRITSANTVPVPNPTVTVSRLFRSSATDPSMLMSSIDSESDALYRWCRRQAFSWQSMEDTIAWADPVSNTTLNSCGTGLPMEILPKYTLLCDTVRLFWITGTFVWCRGTKCGHRGRNPWVCCEAPSWPDRNPPDCSSTASLHSFSWVSPGGTSETSGSWERP
mmetsp:Transcript_17508/g.51159  ORF Transcript_17508/g.51159 Transcript_17508/m.51159 type:complete len:349 (-) Transcript_17508:164-1210(-)